MQGLHLIFLYISSVFLETQALGTSFGSVLISAVCCLAGNIYVVYNESHKLQTLKSYFYALDCCIGFVLLRAC